MFTSSARLIADAGMLPACSASRRREALPGGHSLLGKIPYYATHDEAEMILAYDAISAHQRRFSLAGQLSQRISMPSFALMLPCPPVPPP